MAGSFDVSTATPSLAGNAIPFLVTRSGAVGGVIQNSILPNVRCTAVQWAEGVDPPTAEFCYVLDDIAAVNYGWPSQFEQLWPIESQGNYCVKTDDRIQVYMVNPNGSTTVVFDGFAQIPTLTLGGRQQDVSFTAVSTAQRAFDVPIKGILERNCDEVGTLDGTQDVAVPMKCRFNPSDDASAGSLSGFQPNMTAANYFTQLTPGDPDSQLVPIFLDPLMQERGTRDSIQYCDYWTIAAAIQYITYEYPNSYVFYPDGVVVRQLLEAYSPSQNGGPLNATTAAQTDVPIRDYDATGKTVPTVIEELLSWLGFVVCWRLQQGLSGATTTSLQVYRRDAFGATQPKLVYLSPRQTAASGPMNPAANNVSQMSMVRDLNVVVNQFYIETAPQKVEISILLAPLFTPNAADFLAPARNQYLASNATTSTSTSILRQYRWFGADETGDGHFTANGWSTVALDFGIGSQDPDDVDETGVLIPVFPANNNGIPSYVKRYRPGSKTLVSLDSQGRPLHARLDVLMPNYTTGNFPALVDPGIVDFTQLQATTSLNLTRITKGWDLLKDRLGIVYQGEDPVQWNIGSKNNAQTLDVISSLTSTNMKLPFCLILTTVIDADQGIETQANKRVASPTVFTRQRNVDARDHFQYCSVHSSSPYYVEPPNTTGYPAVVIRNDTALSQSHANQLRAAHEFPPISGSIRIPYFTQYYQIGDRIQQIYGRGATLQVNAGVDQGEAPTYAWVVAIRWELQVGSQSTTLQLSDRRAEVRNSW